jgi:hypothetical protein
MKKIYYIMTALLVILSLTSLAAAPAAEGTNFGAHLSGDEEVPPEGVVIETEAQGDVLFVLSRDGTKLHYKLRVADIENVVAAHIHVGQPGVNGPVVVLLFGPAAPGGGSFDGVLARGTITEANLSGPLAGQPFSALIAEIEAGNTYVNVHTNDGVDPPNTGPGDFPGGEIRGQLH